MAKAQTYTDETEWEVQKQIYTHKNLIYRRGHTGEKFNDLVMVSDPIGKKSKIRSLYHAVHKNQLEVD